MIATVLLLAHFGHVLVDLPLFGGPVLILLAALAVSTVRARHHARQRANASGGGPDHDADSPSTPQGDNMSTDHKRTASREPTGAGPRRLTHRAQNRGPDLA